MFFLLQKFGNNWEMVDYSNNQQDLLRYIIESAIEELGDQSSYFIDDRDILQTLDGNFQYYIFEIENDGKNINPSSLFDNPKNRLQLLKHIYRENNQVIEKYQDIIGKIKSIEEEIRILEQEN